MLPSVSGELGLGGLVRVGVGEGFPGTMAHRVFRTDSGFRVGWRGAFILVGGLGTGLSFCGV